MVFLLAAIRAARRVEFFAFTDQWKRPLFVIIRERNQTAECEAFVRDLLDRIEHSETSLPVTPEAVSAASVSSVRLPTADTERDEVTATMGWKFAIVAGVVSMALPLISAFVLKEPVELNGTLVLVACLFSVMATISSFAANERRKYWSLLGLGLALLPFGIY